MKALFCIITLILLELKFYTAQEVPVFCGSDQYVESYKLSNNNYNDFFNSLFQATNNFKLSGESEEDFVIYIPVVFHIVYNELNSGCNISDQQIWTQLFVLNNSFLNSNSHPLGSNVKVQFCMAKRDPFGNFTTGITRHQYGLNEYIITNGPNSQESTLKNIDYWPPQKYLNIWVANLKIIDNNSVVDLPGMSTFPQFGNIFNDGIMLNYKYCGDNFGTANITNYSDGKVLVHEAGHWLGLFHTFQQTNCDGCINAPSGGDYILDTEPRINACYYDSYWISGIDRKKRLTCNSSCQASYPLISAENYMDYNYTQHMNFFTSDQKIQMRYILKTYRSIIYNFNKTNNNVLPIECNNQQQYSSEQGELGQSDCDYKRYPDQWLRMNAQTSSHIELCEGTNPTINRFHNATSTCLKKVCNKVSIPCNGDDLPCTGNCVTSLMGFCTRACFLIGACTCCEWKISYFFSISYDCDDNYNCNSETSMWKIYKCYGESIPANWDVASLLNFNMSNQSKYKIKLAYFDENQVWREGIKYLDYIPVDLNLPPYKYSVGNSYSEIKAINNITISNLTLQQNKLYSAGNQINIKPSTHVTPNNQFRINTNSCNGLISKYSFNDSTVHSGVNSNSNLDSIDYSNLISEYHTLRQNWDKKSELESIIGFSIFPNPSNSQILNFQTSLTSDYNLEVRNSLGTIVFSKHFENNNQFGTINLNELVNGVYFVIIKSELGSEVKKFILNK